MLVTLDAPSTSHDTPSADFEITFSKEDVEEVIVPHNDVIVIASTIGNYEVHRNLVDNGVSANILSYECFAKMELSLKNLEPKTRPLFSFTRERVVPEGIVQLPISLGEEPKKITVIAAFTVTKTPMRFNAIFDRPLLVEFRAFSSVFHQLVKFPTPNGIGKVRSEQHFSRRIYYEAILEYESPMRDEVSIVEDLDPRILDQAAVVLPGDDLESITLDDDGSRRVFIARNLPSDMK